MIQKQTPSLQVISALSLGIGMLAEMCVVFQCAVILYQHLTRGTCGSIVYAGQRHCESQLAVLHPQSRIHSWQPHFFLVIASTVCQLRDPFV